MMKSSADEVGLCYWKQGIVHTAIGVLDRTICSGLMVHHSSLLTPGVFPVVVFRPTHINSRSMCMLVSTSAYSDDAALNAC